MKDIIDKINEHRLVYENYAMTPPTYRMTLNEHKELLRCIKCKRDNELYIPVCICSTCVVQIINWVSVEDKLPYESKWCLLYSVLDKENLDFNENYKSDFMSIGCYIPDAGFSYPLRDHRMKVTHWADLPDKPE